MGTAFWLSWEPALMEWLQLNMNSVTLAWAKLSSFLGGEHFLVALMGYYYWCLDKRTGIYSGINVAVSLILNPMAKNLVCRRRPYFDIPGVKCLLPVEKGADLYDIAAQGFSFPSGHSANSMALYGSLMVKAASKALRIIFGLVIFMIGISRVFVGCHFPTDVLVGWVLGAAVLYELPLLRRRFESKKLFYAAVFAVSALGCIWCRTTDYYSGLGIMGGMFAGDLFEEKYVRFENTKSPLWSFLRLTAGLGIFLAITNVFKLPFSREFLESASAGSWALRVLRYGIATFTVIGIYPALFKIVEKPSKAAEKGA